MPMDSVEKKIQFKKVYTMDAPGHPAGYTLDLLRHLPGYDQHDQVLVPGYLKVHTPTTVNTRL